MYAKKGSGKKVVATLLAIVLLIGGAIGGTLAWLTANTTEVTNTFTVGNITIDLKEHKLGDDGKLTADEVTENKNYKIVPGGTQPKDPFVTVKKDSENCYVYVLVTNELGTNVTLNIHDNWVAIGTKENSTLYRHNAIVPASSTDDQSLQVFSEVKYADTITETTITGLAGKTIVIDAYAHQSDNTTQDVADAAAMAHFSLTSTT